MVAVVVSVADLNTRTASEMAMMTLVNHHLHLRAVEDLERPCGAGEKGFAGVAAAGVAAAAGVEWYYENGLHGYGMWTCDGDDGLVMAMKGRVEMMTLESMV